MSPKSSVSFVIGRIYLEESTLELHEVHFVAKLCKIHLLILENVIRHFHRSRTEFHDNLESNPSKYSAIPFDHYRMNTISILPQIPQRELITIIDKFANLTKLEERVLPFNPMVDVIFSFGSGGVLVNVAFIFSNRV
jgi:hypothetical protein